MGQKSLFVCRLFTHEILMKIRPPTKKTIYWFLTSKPKSAAFQLDWSLEMCWKSAAGTKVVWSCWRQFFLILHEISLSEVNYARTWTWFSFKSFFVGRMFVLENSFAAVSSSNLVIEINCKSHTKLWFQSRKRKPKA